MRTGWWLLAVLVAAPAWGAGRPAPLCERPEVLNEVARIVRGWNVYNTIDAYSVTELPTTRANAVVCFATMETIDYIDTPTGVHPRTLRETRRFDVQVSGNRFAVQVPR